MHPLCDDVIFLKYCFHKFQEIFEILFSQISNNEQVESMHPLCDDVMM